MKTLILLLLCLTSINKVFSLNCYVTDIKAIKDGDIRPKVQNCKDNIRDALNMQGQSAVNIPDETVFNCYQVNVISDAMSLAIKGCIPEGGCDLMKETFRVMFDRDPTTPVKEVNCHECGSNKCNSGTPQSNSSNMKCRVNFAIAILVVFAVIT